MKWKRFAVIVAIIAFFFYGVAVGTYQIFPFSVAQAAKRMVIPPSQDSPPVLDGLEYDWENDPIGSAFHGKIPPLLENLVARYERTRRYTTGDFPLNPDQHATFRKEVTDALVNSMSGYGGSGTDWVVNSDVKQSSTLRRFDVEPVDTVLIEGTTVHLFAVAIHDTGDVIPMAVCFPERVPAPAVIAFSGHTHYGLRELFVDASSYQSAIALKLCQAGFATAAVEKIDSGILSRLFQEKGERWRGDVWADDEFEAATTILATDDYWLPGRQLMANIAAIEYMAAHPDVDHERMGAVGVSLGGWLTLQTALVNSRIRAVANFGGMWAYLEPYAGGAELEDFEGVNDYSQLFPGIWRLGDQNRFVLAAAPLQMLTGYGRQDFPYTTYTGYFHPVLKEQYELFGAGDRLEIYVHDGGHVLPVEPVVDFFSRRLELAN